MSSSPLALPSAILLLSCFTTSFAQSFNGTPTVVASQTSQGLNQPSAVAVDAQGDVYIADTGNDRIVEEPWNPRSSSYETQKILVSNLNTPTGLAVDGQGDLFFVQADSSQVVELPWNKSANAYGKATTVGTDLVTPVAVAVDAQGDVYIADEGANAIVEVPPGCNAASQPTCTRQVTVGSNLSRPVAVAFDREMNVYIANQGDGNVLQVPAGCNSSSNPVCSTQTAVDQAAGVTALAVSGLGDLYLTQTDSGDLVEVPWVRLTRSYGDAKTLLSDLTQPKGLATDRAGNLYIADTGGNEVLKLTRQSNAGAGFGGWGMHTPR